MGNCCSSGSMKSSADTCSATEIPETANCPADGQSCRSVELRTVLHQLKRPHANHPTTQGYYFCNNNECDVVYFGQDGSVITRYDVRCEVGQKSRSPDRVICYCFGITESDVLGEMDHQLSSSAREFVIEQTRLQNCACDVRNPSGRCCLKDFPKAKRLPDSATSHDCDAAVIGASDLE